MKSIEETVLPWLIALVLGMLLLLSGEVGAELITTTQSGPIACRSGL